MPRFVVNVPESDLASGGLHRKTPGQFLADYAEVKGRTRVFDLPSPVRLSWVGADERTAQSLTVSKSTHLFRALHAIARERGTLTGCSWRGAKLGPAGLYALNYALRTRAKKRDGLNIVRSFLAERGALAPLRGDWFALLSFLEIRPLFRAVKKAAAITAALSLTAPTLNPPPATLGIMSRKTRDIRKRKRRTSRRGK